MKKLISTLYFTVLSVFLMATTALAQEGDGGGLDVDVQVGESSSVWYTNPLYWIIGGLLLIVLIAVIVRGSKSSD